MRRRLPFAALRDRAGFQVRAVPMRRTTPAARAVLVGAAVLCFLGVCTAFAFVDGLDEGEAPDAALDVALRPWAWIPAAYALSAGLGALLFLFPARRGWRLGAILLAIVGVAPLVATAVAAVRGDAGEGGEVALLGVLASLPALLLVGLAREVPRRRRQDRLR